MNWTLFPLLMILTIPAWASQKRLLKCLGAEEKRYHLNKETGPFYELNQRLIAEVVQIPRVRINDDDFSYICGSPDPSESWKFLKLSIQKGADLFILPKDVAGVKRMITKGMVDDYLQASREILVNFINQIQMQSPTPNCLLEEYPKLGEFFRDIKYLQEDVDMKAIFRGRDEKIFLELKKYEEAFQRCRERLKKKPRSRSTTEAR
jgi:hypothetical protein